MQAVANHTYQCASIVRRNDHDRYLTVLHARIEDRPGLFGLYAFNVEVAKTPYAITTNPMCGHDNSGRRARAGYCGSATTAAST